MDVTELALSVLIPFRGDGARRDELFKFVRAAWQQLPVEVFVGSDPGDAPFNISRAFNDAASQASGDCYLLASADALPPTPEHLDWIVTQLETHPWLGAYAETGAYSKVDSDRILKGENPDRFTFEQWAPFCTGAIALHRDIWNDVNGMDERFHGWGCEDTAFRLTLETLHGQPPEPRGCARSLWHPAASREFFETNADRLGYYITAAAEGNLYDLVAGNR